VTCRYYHQLDARLRREAEFRAWRTSDVRMLREIARDGRTVRYAADAMQRSYGSAWSAAKRHGVELRPAWWPVETAERVRRLHSQGMTVREAATAVGVPYATARHWVYLGYRRAA
jgi:hypothetical protein